MNNTLKNYKKQVKAYVDRKYPEKPVRCFAEAMRYGCSQSERREILEELELEDDT